jgi:hypothetical protein
MKFFWGGDPFQGRVYGVTNKLSVGENISIKEI